MPHVVVEYTANLRAEADVPALLQAINAYLIDQRTADGPVFPVGGIRSRAIELTDFCVADGQDPDDAFVHVRITIGAGRDAAVKQALHDGLFDTPEGAFRADPRDARLRAVDGSRRVQRERHLETQQPAHPRQAARRPMNAGPRVAPFAARTDASRPHRRCIASRRST